MKNYLTAKLFRRIEDKSTLCYRGREGDKAIFQKVDKSYINIKQYTTRPQDFIVLDGVNELIFTSSNKLITYLSNKYSWNI